MFTFLIHSFLFLFLWGFFVHKSIYFSLRVVQLLIFLLSYYCIFSFFYVLLFLFFLFCSHLLVNFVVIWGVALHTYTPGIYIIYIYIYSQFYIIFQFFLIYIIFQFTQLFFISCGYFSCRHFFLFFFWFFISLFEVC